MIKVAIVEDDERDVAILRSFLERYGEEQKESFDIRYFGDAFDFVSDYVPEYDVTNMAQYALKGYEVDAVDFLVKPISYDGFAEKLRRAFGFSFTRRSVPILVGTESGDGLVRILCSDVCYAEKDKNYVVYHCRDGSVYRKREQLHEAGELLCKHGFAYINSGCLVNFFDVRKLTQATLTVGGVELPLARRRRQDFLAEYMRWLSGRSPGKDGRT